MESDFVLSTHSYKIKYADPLPVWELWAIGPCIVCMYVSGVIEKWCRSNMLIFAIVCDRGGWAKSDKNATFHQRAMGNYTLTADTPPPSYVGIEMQDHGSLKRPPN
jgi:hypothetical protein